MVGTKSKLKMIFLIVVWQFTIIPSGTVHLRVQRSCYRELEFLHIKHLLQICKKLNLLITEPKNFRYPLHLLLVERAFVFPLRSRIRELVRHTFYFLGIYDCFGAKLESRFRLSADFLSA